MQQFDLTGQVAIVTGGSRGIGGATAVALAAQGATVAAVSRNESPAPVTSAGRIVTMTADVGVPEDMQRLVDDVMTSFGRIDMLINNAGHVSYLGPTLGATLAEWDAMFTVNLRGTFVLTQAVVTAWMGAHGGSIVNVASVAGLRAGATGLGIYGVAKAGLLLLTRQLAQELGSRRVRVNAVAPGLIETDFSAGLWGNPQVRERIERGTPLGRLGQADDVASVIAFLAGPGAAFINGETITVDGGVLA